MFSEENWTQKKCEFYSLTFSLLLQTMLSSEDIRRHRTSKTLLYHHKRSAVKSSSHQNEQPLKTAPKMKLFLFKEIHFLQPCLFFFSNDYKTSGDTFFLSFKMCKLIIIIKHNGKVNANITRLFIYAKLFFNSASVLLKFFMN